MSSDPTFFVQLSDPHLRLEEPERTERFRRAVAKVAALEPAPVCVLLTGDVADTGSADEYAVATETLAQLDFPVLVLPGNKDDRAAMREAFELAGAPDDRIERVAVHAGLRFVTCDTQVPGELHGNLDVERLRAVLEEDHATPTVIALHHPPHRVGAAGLDAIGLPARQRAALDSLLADHPAVLRVISGHVHQASVGAVGGVPSTTCPALGFSLALPLGRDTVDRSDDPPGYALHVLVDGDLVTRFVPLAG